MIHVAIAEDDFRIASIQEEFVKQLTGFTLAGKALNAEDTLALLQKKRVDVLLLDIYMPDMLGTELLPIIKNRFPKIDIIMVTAASEKEMLEEALRYGVFHYLIKPVSLEKFTSVLNEYKKKKQLLQDTSQVTQDIVDAYFAGNVQASPQAAQLPTGIDSVTLNRVSEVLENLRDGVSIEEMGTRIGASRTTARRYLEYLVTVGKCRVEHEYGIVGRPERRYFKVGS
ncbi:response regulator [Domibacillus indicus]|uniref:response regulator n=1 Tax=Domibacillus indicus TaxID=1437523 RepID=UPI002040362F|nr:response regulator [Domibacillus indicus]MCM3788078.1 response regulator [Domibacillus indicus]